MSHLFAAKPPLMNFNPFNIFKKKQNFHFPKAAVIEKLKIVAKENNFYIFENTIIYHHTQQLTVPLLVLDTQDNIYLFEFKKWSVKDLKNSSIQKTVNKKSESNNLAFNEKQKYIKKRLNEITNQDDINICNFLLIENLTTQQYNDLDATVKELLPQNRIIFNDSCEDEILEKLTQISYEHPQNTHNATFYLFIQYMMLSHNNTAFMSTYEQINFINSNIKNHQVLHALPYSGKTTSLLLKAIYEKLKNPSLSIIIISPTPLSCDIMKQKLLNIVEMGHVEIDIASIQIIPPTLLINAHLSKLHKPLLDNQIYIENTLMEKSFKAADLIMCDDADMLPNDFIAYLMHLQKNSSLVLVSNNIILKNQYTFSKDFLEKKVNSLFIKSDPYANAIHIISKLLKDHPPEEIFVISSNLTRKKLYDDLQYFIEDKAILLDSSLNLIHQDLHNLLLSTYEQINTNRVKFIVLLDISSASIKELENYCALAKNTAYILYEDECEKITTLKETYASKKK